MEPTVTPFGRKPRNQGLSDRIFDHLRNHPGQTFSCEQLMHVVGAPELKQAQSACWYLCQKLDIGIERVKKGYYRFVPPRPPLQFPAPVDSFDRTQTVTFEPSRAPQPTEPVADETDDVSVFEALPMSTEDKIEAMKRILVPEGVSELRPKKLMAVANWMQMTENTINALSET